AGAGHTWTPAKEQFYCSGIPESIGVTVESYLSFCEDRLCDLTGIVTFDPTQPVSNQQLQQIVDGLHNRYGRPTTKRVKMPESCKPRFVECVAEGTAFWQVQWKWPSGKRIVARVDPHETAVRFAVRYVMGTPGTVDTSAF